MEAPKVQSTEETEIKEEVACIQKEGDSFENDKVSNSEESMWVGWDELMGKDLMMLKVRKGIIQFPM